MFSFNAFLDTPLYLNHLVVTHLAFPRVLEIMCWDGTGVDWDGLGS